ncbi:hypothetical protein GCM10023168_17360 [Fodinibacter luteus]|uniref:Uncharacterized protein n=1 Tax=Fodinibacter luteus TaxID=552064 RepID=A0ABP8KDY6_9MICO
MPGRSSYTADEVEACRANADALLAAWEANDVDDTTLENLVFAQAVVALDAWFAHRLRTLEGTGGNPMNEVRVLADSIVGNDGRLRLADGIRWAPERTVLRLAAGDEVLVSADDYERLAGSYLAAIEATYVDPAS